MLKRDGEIVISDGIYCIISWKEKTKRKRTYHYLTKLLGEKYTRVTRLRPKEYTYWLTSLKNKNNWFGKQNK